MNHEKEKETSEDWFDEFTEYQKRDIFLKLNEISDIMKYKSDEHNDYDLFLMFKFYSFAYLKNGFKNLIKYPSFNLLQKTFSEPFNVCHNYPMLFLYKLRRRFWDEMD